MKALVVVVALVATESLAQSPGSELALLPILGPPMLASVALDLVLLASLATEGTAKRGGAITTMVFGTIGMIISGLCLGIGLGSRGNTLVWTGLSAGALAIETGTVAVGVYGVIRAEPEPEPPPKPERRRVRVAPESQPPELLPPQLFLTPFKVAF